MGSVKDTIPCWSRVELKVLVAPPSTKKRCKVCTLVVNGAEIFHVQKSTEGFGGVSETNKQQIQNDGGIRNKALF